MNCHCITMISLIRISKEWLWKAQIKLQIHKEKFEDTKGVIRSHKSNKDKQYNGQKKTDKGTNSYLQNIIQKTTDREPRALEG